MERVWGVLGLWTVQACLAQRTLSCAGPMVRPVMNLTRLPLASSHRSHQPQKSSTPGECAQGKQRVPSSQLYCHVRPSRACSLPGPPATFQTTCLIPRFTHLATRLPFGLLNDQGYSNLRDILLDAPSAWNAFPRSSTGPIPSSLVCTLNITFS